MTVFQERSNRVFLLPAALAFFNRGREFAFERQPFPAQWRHQNRFNQRADVRLAGVVCAKLGALAFVQGAFKQRAHNGRLNELPVGFGGFDEGF